MERKELVLVAVKDSATRQKLAKICQGLGVEAQKAGTWSEAQSRLKSRYFDIVILNMGGSQRSCTEMIQTIRRMGLDSCILICSPPKDAAAIAGCLKEGAYDTILLPLNEAWARTTIARAFERRRYYELAQNKDQYWQLFIFDELTRVHNHRYFHLSLEKVVGAAVRYGYPVSLLMIDIDNFKAYNDSHGHIAGDEVLRSIGAFLMKAIRGSDTVARYGGEEFTLVLPHTNSEGALVLAERIRSELERQDFPSRNAAGPARITVSIGIASFPADAKTKDEIISRAGLALARAKKKGKNRVCCAGS